MPEELQEVAIYHYLDDMDQDEIAEIIGMSRRTVRVEFESSSRYPH